MFIESFTQSTHYHMNDISPNVPLLWLIT